MVVFVVLTEQGGCCIISWVSACIQGVLYNQRVSAEIFHRRTDNPLKPSSLLEKGRECLATVAEAAKVPGECQRS